PAKARGSRISTEHRNLLRSLTLPARRDFERANRPLLSLRGRPLLLAVLLQLLHLLLFLLGQVLLGRGLLRGAAAAQEQHAQQGHPGGGKEASHRGPFGHGRLRGSWPSREPAAVQTSGSTLSTTKRTAPSAMQTLTPPEW